MGIGIDAIIMGVLVSFGSVLSLMFSIVAVAALRKYQVNELERRIKKVENAMYAGVIMTFVICVMVVFFPGVRFELLISWPFIVAYVFGAVASGLRIYIELISD